MPLSEVVRILHEESEKLDPDHRGINFAINPYLDENAIPMVDSVTGLPMATNAAYDSELTSIPITINHPLTNISLGDVLNALVLVAPKPIHYSVEDYAIVFSAGKPPSPLYSRHFRLDVNRFIGAVHSQTGMQTNSVPAMAKDYFKTLGVDLDVSGKSAFYNDRLGELFVRATTQDLDIIENAMEPFSRVSPQIHIKAQFLEVPKESLALLRPFPELTNGVTILSDAAFRKLMQTLESNPGTETLAEPEVVTTSGRQTEMRSTTLMSTLTLRR